MKIGKWLLVGGIAAAMLWTGILVYQSQSGEVYGKAVFYRDITMGSWVAMSNIIAATTGGGSYSNSVTNYYRLSGTNRAGRLPVSTNIIVAINGSAGTNAVLFAWPYYDGLRNYVLEYSGDAGSTWTQWVGGISARVTNYTDLGTNVWTETEYTSVVSFVPAPTSPWGSSGTLALVVATYKPLDYGGSRAATGGVPMGGFDITDLGDISGTNAAFAGAITGQSVTATDFDAGGDVDLTNATAHVAEAVGADQPVPLSQLQDTLELYGEVRLYFATNVHPVVTNDRSLFADFPADGVWTQAHVLAAGTNLLNTYILTNTVTVAPPGSYVASVFMSFAGVGGPDVSGYLELFETDGVGVTNMIGTSSVAAVSGSLIARDMATYVSMSCACTNQYLGVNLYGIRAGGVSATLTVQGGSATYHSHLLTPVLGSASVIWEDIIGPYTDRVDLNSAITDRYTKAEADAAFLEPTDDGSALTNISDSISFMIYAPTNGEPWAWAKFDWSCVMTNVEAQMQGPTGTVDIGRKEWNEVDSAAVVINSNIQGKAASVRDSTFADANYTNGQDIGIRWRDISAISPTGTLKCTIRARK